MEGQKQSINWQSIFSPKQLFLKVLGVALSTIAIKGFMIPNHFMDGGVSGISILIHEITHLPINILIVGFNLPFIIIGYRRFGKTFGMQMVISTVLLGVALTFLPFPTVTNDRLLTSIFGGVLMGAGVGLVIRGGGVLDGAEVIALFTTKKIGLTSSEIILFLNALIFISAGFALGVETAMYSMITFYTATKVVDYIVDGLEEYTALTIISSKPETVKVLLVQFFGKAITVYKGERGYLPDSFEIREDTDIILTIVTRLEILMLTEAINEVDPKAFMFAHSIRETKGGIVKKIKAD
ncbi:MAG: YitT family protein [Chloroherpetonaceae bacterium]|nr:YitT family protein [Chloroherpetonaceae bacterium]